MRCGNCFSSRSNGINKTRCWTEFGICGQCMKIKRKQDKKTTQKKCARCGGVVPKYKSKYCSYECMGLQNWASDEKKEKLRLRYL